MTDHRRPILKDTCLCMIVRNEETNPAGGIAKFCEHHLPFFEFAEIVDTGSIDSTPGILREMQKKFPWMRVHSMPFRGFASSRNYGLGKALEIGAKNAMVLDADERLFPGSALRLAEKLTEAPNVSGWCLEVKYIYPNWTASNPYGMNPRIFKLLPNVCFIGEGALESTEHPYVLKGKSTNRIDCRDTGETIYHFCPDREAFQQKALRTYGTLYTPVGNEWEIEETDLLIDPKVMTTHPSKLEWKQTNSLSSEPEESLKKI